MSQLALSGLQLASGNPRLCRDHRSRGQIVALADLTPYSGRLGLPAPSVTAVGVDGGANAPGQDTNADGEVMLDIEVVGAVAPGAAIAVYFAPNTDHASSMRCRRPCTMRPASRR